MRFLFFALVLNDRERIAVSPSRRAATRLLVATSVRTADPAMASDNPCIARRQLFHCLQVTLFRGQLPFTTATFLSPA
jgi:hypothetical protein